MRVSSVVMLIDVNAQRAWRIRMNLLGHRTAPSNPIGANAFAVGVRSLGWRLRHPEGTRPRGAP
jgi:hypothetical protein